MRHWMAEIALLVSAVNGVADLGEKDRIRHRRVVPLVAAVIDFHAEWLKAAAWCVVAAASSRHRPVVKLLAVDRDGHALGGFVDLNQKVGVGSLAKRQRRKNSGSQRDDEAVDAH